MKRNIVLALLCAVSAGSTAAAQDRSIPAYLTTKAPKIDGKIDAGEWDAAGPAIFVNKDRPDAGFGNAIAEDPFGGDADLSFQFRAMWEAPYTVYMLVEINDDIAMSDDPPNLWERDQVELFFDGNDQHGNSTPEEFQWWDHPEPFGKFGVSRYNTWEGNAGRMTDSTDNLYANDDTDFIAAAAQAAETGVKGNYFVEYAVSIESMFLRDAFSGDAQTKAADEIVADHTMIKAQVAVSDDDNFEDTNANTSRSSSLAHLGLSDWRMTTEFADLLFKSAYSAGPKGDFNKNGSLDIADIDALSAAVKANSNDLKYDVDGNSKVDDDDRGYWLHSLKKVWVGDADLSGGFDSNDMVTVFIAGKYETGAAASWGDGDFDGDGTFGSSDLVAAFVDGGYEAGPHAAVAAVPEPSALVLLTLGVLPMLRRKQG